MPPTRRDLERKSSHDYSLCLLTVGLASAWHLLNASVDLYTSIPTRYITQVSAQTLRNLFVSFARPFQEQLSQGFECDNKKALSLDIEGQILFSPESAVLTMVQAYSTKHMSTCASP